MRLEACRGALQSKGLRVIFMYTKRVISSENTGKVTEVGKFLCTVCRKDVGSNYILCHFCRCWVHRKFVIQGKLKENSTIKC